MIRGDEKKETNFESRIHLGKSNRLVVLAEEGYHLVEETVLNSGGLVEVVNRFLAGDLQFLISHQHHCEDERTERLTRVIASTTSLAENDRS